MSTDTNKMVEEGNVAKICLTLIVVLVSIPIIWIIVFVLDKFDRLVKEVKRIRCYYFHKKTLNIVVTSIGSVSHEYCHKCKLKH